MNIILKEGYDENESKREAMIIDGKEKLFVQALCECPEDCTIERDLVSCSQVIRFMEMAWQAGVDGESFSVTKEPMED
jgi:hypothetical protein